MNEQITICQSCGMPLEKDPFAGGTNANGSLNDKYCSFCFRNGKFIDEGITLQEKIDKNVKIAITKLNIPEDQAKEMAYRIIPNLERWR